jgi:hypothetical protein
VVDFHPNCRSGKLSSVCVALSEIDTVFGPLPICVVEAAGAEDYPDVSEILSLGRAIFVTPFGDRERWRALVSEREVAYCLGSYSR